MKKTTFLLFILFVALAISCESDPEAVGPTQDSSSSNGMVSNESLNSRFEGALPESSFDFASNTIMVDVNGEQFPVVDIGEGPVAVLLHGWPDSKEMWRYQIPFLANAGYRVVVPDLRGFGDAPKTENQAAYALTALMGDVLTILDNMGITEKVNLVTHDWGAAIGWTMARFVQDRVNSFITISIGAPGNPGFDLMEQRRQNWYLYFFAQQEGVAEYEMTKDDWTLFRAVVFHPDEDNIIQNLSQPGALSASFRPYRENYQSLLAGCPGQVYEPGDPFDVEFPVVNAPTLGILGANDFAMLEPQMKLSRDQVVDGNFKYIYYDDVGHWMMLEKPRRVNNVIKRFLDCHAKSSPRCM